MKKMNIINEKSFISFPINFWEKSKNIPLGHVCPCSILFQNNEIGGIIISCTSQDLKYLNIVPNAPIQPALKFRMLNIEKLVYVIEIWMLFGKKLDKFLKLHLNPYNSDVKKLFKLVTETKMLSFHFNNMDSDLLGSGFTLLDGEHLSWFERNYQLLRRLMPLKEFYPEISEKLSKTISKNDLFFKYYECKKNDFFVKKSDRFELLNQDNKKNLLLK
jgi:hypothetical protein